MESSFYGTWFGYGRLCECRNAVDIGNGRPSQAARQTFPHVKWPRVALVSRKQKSCHSLTDPDWLIWEDSIRMDLEHILINTRNWVDSAQGRDYWSALVNKPWR